MHAFAPTDVIANTSDEVSVDQTTRLAAAHDAPQPLGLDLLSHIAGGGPGGSWTDAPTGPGGSW